MAEHEQTHDAEPSVEEIRVAHFQREELWPIIRRAEVLGASVPNPRWRRAYQDLAQAASNLDAFIARSTVHPGQREAGEV